MHSYEEKMRAVELYLKYGLSAAAVINELEQHIKKNKLPAKDQRVVLSHNNYIRLFGGFCGRDSGIGPAQRAKTTIWN